VASFYADENFRCTYDPDAKALSKRIIDAVSGEPPGERWLVSVVRPNLSAGATRAPKRK
jgi:hypothetical protein